MDKSSIKETCGQYCCMVEDVVNATWIRSCSESCHDCKECERRMICRVCYNPKLTEIGSLGDIALSDFTVTPSEGTKLPLTLVYCERCNLLQLLQNSPRNLIYEHQYWYKSSLNLAIVQDLKEIVGQIRKLVEVKPYDVWIDIGANDGTLLSFVPDRTLRLAVDPAPNFTEELKKNCDKHFKTYWEDFTAQPINAKVITAIACLYDLPDPNSFMANIKRQLASNGIFVAQLMTLQPMIDNNDVGNICHEHLEFYSYKSLVKLFEQNGLEIFKVDKNGMNGGSYRLFARHYKGGSTKFKEKEYSVKALRGFFQRIENNKKQFLAWIKGKTVYGYGASTKGNILMQYYGLTNNDIKAMIDINPEKIGKYTVSTKIPIVKDTPNDGYLWVIPYGFIDYFRAKEKNTRFVTSIPEFKVYET